MYEKSKYEEWSTNYDEYVKEMDRNGKYPFAGYESVILTIAKTIKSFDNDASVLDLACGTGSLEELLKDGNHKITAIDFSPKMIEIASSKNSNVEYINADLTSEELFQKLEGKKFKVIVSTFFLHHLETEQRKNLIYRLVENHLDDNGLFFIGDTMFSSLEAKEMVKNNNLDHWNNHNYIVYSELKKDFSNAVFQQVSFCTGIIAFKHFEIKHEQEVEDLQQEEQIQNNEDDNEVNEENNEVNEENNEVVGEEVLNEEITEETKDESNEETNEKVNNFVVYSQEEVDSWKRVRDIPGESIYEFGTNFIRALDPYEKEAYANWEYIAPQLQNSYGGTFTNGDIFNFRYQSINILVSSNMNLPEQEKEYRFICGLLAASYLHNRFPSSKIGLNLYGLYFGLINDIQTVLKRIYDDYQNDLDSIRNDLKNIRDTKLAKDLSLGLRK